MMGYYPLTHGEIRIDGRPLASLSHSALRRGIAMVQQDPVVLADTFYANVALGRGISEAQVWEALEAVQLAAVARSMSDGLYTQLGEQGNNLRRAEAATGAGSRAGGHPAGTDFG